jgi:phosphatidyl-myo-inositol dimannoside synthase
MKTLLLTPELFTTDSGIPRMLRLYLKALCENAGNRDRVSFVTLNDSKIDAGKLARYSTPALARRVACNGRKMKFIWSTLRQCWSTNLIVCGHVAQLPVAWLASLLHPGLKVVLIAHGIEVWRPFGFWERRALKSAWKILCVSEFTRQEILQRVQLRPDRLVVVPNTLDPLLESSPTQQATDQCAPVILAVSRLNSADNYKGIDHLIMAMPAIHESVPNATLRIVGRGDDITRLQNLASSLQLGRRVKFAGYIGDDQLTAEFSTCTCFALPSLKEGFGLVYLEAMSAGKPCLAAAAGGAPEVITPESGLLVE